MKTSSILDTYQTWLTHREYSPATIQKYTKALARFFADTGAGDIPTRETVAAWRDSLTEKGYTPATVNAMLAAVNDCQESIDNVAGKAKPLKHQRRIFADPGRELTRAEYFRLLNAARAAGNKRTQLLLEALCSTGTRVSELQFITAEAVRRHKASIRCKGKCREILLPAELCHRLTRWCQKHRIHAGPVFLSRVGKPLSRVTVWKLLKALCERANVAGKKVFLHNLRHLFARTFYNLEKNISKLADLLGHSSIETTRIYTPDITTPKGRRHLVLLTVLYDTAARVSELADIRMRDVRLDSPAAITLHGKGGKVRTVPLMKQTVELLQSYFTENGITPQKSPDMPLFWSGNYRKLTRSGITYIVQKYAAAAQAISTDIPATISPHVFRHTKAMHLVQANVNTVYIKDYLGHADISTTEIYARADNEAKHAALEKASLCLELPCASNWEQDADLIAWLSSLG